ncbi:MAG: succinyl-diaminopimelate desuccinylase [Frankiales bacterium]|nr:succinyl-diaminopimelate desuccinylase [Frankiales bacterium]
MTIDLGVSGDALTAALVDVPSESGNEKVLADAVESALSVLPHLSVERDGDAIVARTDLGRSNRVLVAGHLDTVPIADNVPSRRDGDVLFGCGSSDMKSGIAVMLRIATTVLSPARDYTLVFYDNEEVEAAKNGLKRLARDHADWLAADLAVLMEPTNAVVEAGCQGTLRADVRLHGTRAHSARPWLGDNAIHRAAPVLELLSAYTPRDVDIDGCTYREGLSAVGIRGGVAGNVIPDECVVSINFRFAPDRTLDAAEAHVREIFAGFDVEVTDGAAGALPGLSAPAAAEFIAAVGAAPTAKYGWTDVARFAELGIPAVNYGPGDPNRAHTREESVDLRLVTTCEHVLRRYLG